MSTAAVHTEEDHGHHHKETFVTKYIFSQDHKMISKQYLITGLLMGIVGIGMSLVFRMQLAWPEKPFGFFDYMYLQKHSFATLSDSGTLSEESSILGRTAIHLRHCTERPEGLENKAIILCQFSEKNLIKKELQH